MRIALGFGSLLIILLIILVLTGGLPSKEAFGEMTYCQRCCLSGPSTCDPLQKCGDC
jgi:hypothetical protein